MEMRRVKGGGKWRPKHRRHDPHSEKDGFDLRFFAFLVRFPMNYGLGFGFRAFKVFWVPGLKNALLFFAGFLAPSDIDPFVGEVIGFGLT